MKISPAPIPGLHVVELERIEDARGYFARTFCEEEFAQAGLPPRFAQCSVSFNLKRGTLRGVHFQPEPFAETKLVRCSRGRMLDVAVDLREGSPTRFQHFAIELSASDGRSLLIPRGFAHGFQTLEDETEVFYHIVEPFKPGHAAGIRHDDPSLAIAWPIADAILSDWDRGLPTVTELFGASAAGTRS